MRKIQKGGNILYTIKNIMCDFWWAFLLYILLHLLGII